MEKDMKDGNNRIPENIRLENGNPQPDMDMPGTGDMPENSGEVDVSVRKSEKRRLFIIVAVAAVIALVIGIGFFGGSKEKRLQEQLDLGAKYIDELEYEQALACYLSAVEIDPMSVDAYLGIVEVYIRTGEYDLALEWAEKGYELTGDEQLAEKAEMIRSGNISRWDGQAVRETHFDANGNISWWLEHTYDRENRENSVSLYGADGNLVKTLPIIYDEEGNLLESYRITVTGELGRRVYGYENGSLVSQALYESDDITIFWWEVYENNKEGKMLKSSKGNGSHIGDESEICGYTEYEYDENGRLIEDRAYDEDYKLGCYEIWEYDEAGRCQRYLFYDADDVLRNYMIYEYSERGKMKSVKKYDGDGKLEYEETYE